jgi:hypothetical protein
MKCLKQNYEALGVAESPIKDSMPSFKGPGANPYDFSASERFRVKRYATRRVHPLPKALDYRRCDRQRSFPCADHANYTVRVCGCA